MLPQHVLASCYDMNMLHIERIYDAPGPTDGYRILSDARWPRGLSKEAAALVFWLKEVAPWPELRRWFNHDVAKFKQCSRLYRRNRNARQQEIGCS